MKQKSFLYKVILTLHWCTEIIFVLCQLDCEIYWEYRTAGHLVFLKLSPAVELKKVLSVTKHSFIIWAQRKPNTRLEIYKAFQDRLTCLNRHMIYFRLARIFRFCEIYTDNIYRTAGHLVFWKPSPVTGYIATAFILSYLTWKSFFY